MATLNHLKKIAAQVEAKRNQKPTPYTQIIHFEAHGKQETREIRHYDENKTK